MALLLNIDSAFEECSVVLSNNEEVIAHEKSAVQKDHASFLQPAIKKICDQASIKLPDIAAVAVVNGPGSYTGLRVGLSSAKGICYALQKPLILINTLDIVAYALKQKFKPEENTLLCPMIDARRMEVFAALYDNHLKIIKEYASVVLNASFLAGEKDNFKIIAGGDGCFKLKNLTGFENIEFETSNYTIKHFTVLAYNAYKLKSFSNLAYSEPFYLKPAYIR